MKDLKEITDSECLRVAEIFGGVSHLSDEKKIAHIKEVIGDLHNVFTNISGIAWHNAFRYLESCGYTFDLTI